MSILSIHYRKPTFFIQINFQSFRQAIQSRTETSQYALLNQNFENLMNLPKSGIRIKHIETESKKLVTEIEIFFSTNFGREKSFEISEKTQGIIVKIFELFSEEKLQTKLDTLYNYLVGRNLILKLVFRISFKGAN